MSSTPLERAIAAGMQPGGQMMDELRKLEGYRLHSATDARAICAALQTLALQGDNERQPISRLYALAGLFQEVAGPDCPAFRILSEEGLRWLLRIYREKLPAGNDDDVCDLLFILKNLSFYGSREVAETVVEAARLPLAPQHSLFWPPILMIYSRNLQRSYVYEALRSPIPPLCIGVGLLESANAHMLAGGSGVHPFDSAEGCERLREWLVQPLPNWARCSLSATTALEFIQHPLRRDVLALALAHADPAIQLEAARIAGKLGDETGLRLLARLATDVAHADVARQHLAALGREDLIPQAADDAAFEAQARLARWFASNREFGRPPDETAVVDRRQLAWPPDRELTPVWLLRFVFRDTTGLEEDRIGYGFVGREVSALPEYKTQERPPEDAYAIHCYCEAESENLIAELDEFDDEQEYVGLLRHWRGAALQQPMITHVAELAPELALPSRIVALASALLEGQPGWVVLDGKNTTWYPQSEQPGDAPAEAVLKLHVGRQLLGFVDTPERRKYLKPPGPGLDPQKVVAAYEELLGELLASDSKRRTRLLSLDGPLARHVEKYISAVAATRGVGRSQATAEVFYRLLELADRLDPPARTEALESFGPLGLLFDQQVDALVALGRGEEIFPLIGRFEPLWRHNGGRTRFGNAALKAGRPDLAETFFVQLRDGMAELNLMYSFAEEMSKLAELWVRRGEARRARELLIQCMQAQLGELSDRRYRAYHYLYAADYRHHRATYLRLFPGEEQELNELKLGPDPQ